MSKFERAFEIIETAFAPIVEIKIAAEEHSSIPRHETQRGDADIKLLGVLTGAIGLAVAAGSGLAGELVDTIPDDWQVLGVGTGAGAVAVGSIIYFCGRK